MHPISIVRMKVSSQLKEYNRKYLSDVFEWLRLYLFNDRFHQIFSQQNGSIVDINVNDAIQPKPKRLRFTGDVYVMTNGHSFSAGTYFPTFIKRYNLGFVVGSETGGLSGGSFGERISVEFSDHGVIPDYSIPRDISKEIHGVDSQLERTLQIIMAHNITKGQ
ncbi:MAG: S41 family peptidase [Calditrichota bacterium]